jgi:hypothetical protein
VGEEGVILEHGVRLALVRRHRGDVAAAELDPAFIGPLKAGDQSEQGRLPRPGWTEQREELAFLDREVDPGDRDDRAVVLANTFQAKGRRFLL